MPHIRWVLFVVLVGLLVNCAPPPQAADMRGASATVVPTSASTTAAPSTPTAAAAAATVAPQVLPLGDGKFSQTGQQGYIFACSTRISNEGAFASGAWLDEKNKEWYPDLKPSVDGQVGWEAASVTIEVAGSTRTISSNALPESHTTGIFPVQSSDDAYQYDRNPNTISMQQILYQLPQMPQLSDTISCLPPGIIGVALTGVPFYNGFDEGGRDAVAHEIQDDCNGHPQQQGQYHYHSVSDCVNTKPDDAGHPALIGYALDGFGIYAANTGNTTLKTADLDECHGIVSEVVWDGVVVNMYHYVATADFPYTMGCFRGTPVQSNATLPADGAGAPPAGGPPAGGGPPPPRRP